jgi:RNA recognition motif-containing protein
VLDLLLHILTDVPSIPYCYRRFKLLDDDDDVENIERPKPMQTTMAWRPPSMLLERPDVTKADLTSSEALVQSNRVQTLPASNYQSDYHVPDAPAPLSDVEQALDMTSQSSAEVASIPFFGPQLPVPVAEPVPAPMLSAYPGSPNMAMALSTQPQYGVPPPTMSGISAAATPEFVQVLGLPMFLVGQDTQALQTLASSPGLLSTLVDAHGMYDQHRLMSLVQTLSSSNVAGHAQQSHAVPYGSVPSASMYGIPQVLAPYGSVPAPTPHQYGGHVAFNGPPAGSYRSSNPDGNLHISGYGPATTQADIIQLFAPYLHVDEVVMKGTFAFVNTSDPVNAQRAREALNGTFLGGMPLRINQAQRRAGGAPAPHSAYGPTSSSIGAASAYGGARVQPPSMPTIGTGPPPNVGGPIPDMDSIQDDRGNPVTKNLFVAGYGPGTTEQQLRELFSSYANVIGVVLKGAFSFVNTSAREEAYGCRAAFNGTMLNGGVLRINFAKESGRLGTSFDLTYGKNTGPNSYVKNTGQSPQGLYYGR